jgi:hypothetical protein
MDVIDTFKLRQASPALPDYNKGFGTYKAIEMHWT